MKISTETMREVWIDDDPHAEHYEIGPDRDGLDCVEIRLKSFEGKIVTRITFPHEVAAAVADAMLLCATELAPPK
jgi:hypothetical protein